MTQRVLGVLAGADLPPEMLKKWAASADILVAADAGADRLLEAGFEADFAVGDFDSISAIARESDAEMFEHGDENYTDCDKLLMFAQANGWEEITLACVEGDRLDHLLSTMHSSIVSPLKIRFALRTAIGWVLKPGVHRLETVPNRILSVIPLLPVPALSLGGVIWPLDRERLAMGELVSISNKTASDLAHIQFDDGAVLAILETPEEEIPVW